MHNFMALYLRNGWFQGILTTCDEHNPQSPVPKTALWEKVFWALVFFLMQKLIKLIMNAIIAEILCCYEYDIPFIIEECDFCSKVLSSNGMVLTAFADSILVILKTLVH